MPRDPVTGQTGRYFLPFDFSVVPSLTKDFTVSLEVGIPIIKDYQSTTLRLPRGSM
jgi:hypothetical protein